MPLFVSLVAIARQEHSGPCLAQLLSVEPAQVEAFGGSPVGPESKFAFFSRSFADQVHHVGDGTVTVQRGGNDP